eukprot:EG_transcript_38329
MALVVASIPASPSTPHSGVPDVLDPQNECISLCEGLLLSTQDKEAVLSSHKDIQSLRVELAEQTANSERMMQAMQELQKKCAALEKEQLHCKQGAALWRWWNAQPLRLTPPHKGQPQHRETYQRAAQRAKLVCAEHDERLKLYCPKCVQLVCTVCGFGKHK